MKKQILNWPTDWTHKRIVQSWEESTIVDSVVWSPLSKVLRDKYLGVIPWLVIMILPRCHNHGINCIITLLQPNNRQEPLVLMNGCGYIPRSFLCFVSFQVSFLLTYLSRKKYTIMVSNHDCTIESSGWAHLFNDPWSDPTRPRVLTYKTTLKHYTYFPISIFQRILSTNPNPT